MRSEVFHRDPRSGRTQYPRAFLPRRHVLETAQRRQLSARGQ